MNVQRIKATHLLLVSLLAMAPALADANTLDRVRTSNTFTLGYLPDLAPFSVQAGDKASGYAIELCQKIADSVKVELGLPDLQVRYQPVSLDDAMTAVSTGKIDILCTPSPPTLARRKQVSYSVPIYTAGLSVVVRQEAPEALINVLNGKVARTGPTWRATVNHGLSDQTYATTAGGITETWIRQQMRLLGVVANLVTVKNTEAGVNLVAEGKADAFFAERIMLSNLLATHPSAAKLVLLDRVFEYSPTAMALDRDDENFRLLVDTALSEMYRSGEIEQACNTYLGGISDMAKNLFKVYAIP
ncbi:amino acid ABC transporter substrate-binding protein, PAAT family [Pseudomonas mohnii]|uniref:Amino acid ABC transporter substrate-binding protein, PAAT family n=1 Tax=Pseudomonas mohnii TaxID=395600 RepID=A0ABY0XL17_9PSED|nr:amino acid ABC transporter substrate-binding protein [Pseudomonas mohnii]SEB59144.1 amino acid ABC transporter substrate-binding protein, PAAT family [Pseudomonas mohnii]